jgi:TonB-linked SusC/RagA family outer membrane protein
MREKFYLFLFLLLAGLQSAVGQTIDVTGVVIDEGGDPIIGASVLVKGTTKGTVTNLDGAFQLSSVRSNEVLVVSFVGMKTQEVSPKPKMTIKLLSEDEQLDEVIVVAFGEQKRSSFTGSATVVKSDVIEKRQTTNVLSALSGQVAGMQMTDNSGDPTATPTIRIRGFSSINAGNDPLIIVDGAPYDGGWNNLNPNDVESINVLKDAASNALYGARGANGVIMITTKKGKAGKATVTLDAKWGANSRAQQDYDKIDNAGQYYEAHYLALKNYYMRNRNMTASEAHVAANNNLGAATANGGLGYISYSVPANEYLIGTNGKLNPNATKGNRVAYNGDIYTITPDNWIDEAFRTSLRQEYNLNISGGDEKTNFYASLGYLSNDGIVNNSDLDRYTARIKADYQARPWLKVGANLNYAHTTHNDIASGSTTLFEMLNNMAPIYPIYLRDANGQIMQDEHGKVYDYGSGENGGLVRPVLSQQNFLQDGELNTNYTKENLTTLTGYADITPLEGLKITVNGTVTNDENHYTSTQQPFYGFGAQAYPGGYVYKQTDQTFSLNFQQIVNYTRDFGKHNMSVMLGHESYKTTYEILYGDRQNMFSYFGSQELDGAVSILKNGGYSTMYNTEGYFFRGMYSYDDRFYASASYRRDASSRFHPDHRWGNFYSVGGAWTLNKEKWFNADWVNLLKVKASWGQQGNDAIGDYRYTDTYSTSSVGGDIAFVLSSVGNESITWETNSNFNFGLDFELFKSRLTGSLEFFSRKTTDMLCFVYVPLSGGYAGSYDNVGDMKNTGIELSLNAHIIRSKDFNWSVNFNATHYKNKVTKLNEGNRGSVIDGHAGYVNGSYFVGEGLPLYSFYTRKYAGVNENGEATWYVKDADGKMTTTNDWSSADKFLTGTADPDLYGGLGTTLSYKGFDFSVNVNYSLGGKAYDNEYATLMTNPSVGLTGFALHKDLLKAWSETNTDSNIPRFQYAVSGSDLSAAYTSDRFITDASYLTLQNVSLGYTLPKQWITKLGLEKLRVYVSGDNLCYLSKRKGFDPRGTFNGNTSSTSYSPVRVITGGVSVQF